MADENSILSALAHIVSIIVPIAGLILAGGKWIISRIEKGQNELWKKYRKLSEIHRNEISRITNELSDKVNIAQCENFRRQCPGCSIFPAALTNNEVLAKKTNRNFLPPKKRKKK